MNMRHLKKLQKEKRRNNTKKNLERFKEKKNTEQSQMMRMTEEEEKKIEKILIYLLRQKSWDAFGTPAVINKKKIYYKIIL